MTDPKNTTDFGYQAIPTHEKTARVGEVFHSVADKYDLMNDVMSLGIHRLWKRFAVDLCQLHPGQRVLDLAGGTGDLTLKMLRQVGNSGQVVLADINETMLTVGRDRLMDGGYLNDHLAIVLANAETLPFPDNYFDRIMMGFGLRNLTDKAAALTSMYRVLKPGGRLIILEFSKPTLELLTKGYDWYSFNLVPKLGKWIAKDEASYQYLVESIRRHPDQATLAELMSHCGFDRCDYHNLTGGIVALHRGYKF